MKKILFVCTGNICRSPMAEGLMRHFLAGRKDITVVSAGVSAQKGNAASQQAVIALAEEGIDLRAFRSQPVTEELLERCTHVITMTRDHKRLLNLFIPSMSQSFGYSVSSRAAVAMFPIRSARESLPTKTAAMSSKAL